MNNTKRSREIWFAAVYPGDSSYKRSVQTASIQFPLRNEKGKDQTITFPPIGNQKLGAAPVKLAAVSNASGAVVHYYVREGPAKIANGDHLEFTPIPPRTNFPIKVTVVAWQWGRSINPLLKTAEPVKRSFHIVK